MSFIYLFAYMNQIYTSTTPKLLEVSIDASMSSYSFNSSWLIFESFKALEIKTYVVFKFCFC